MELDREESNLVTVISDNGEKLSWDISVYDRTRFKEIKKPFKEVNTFLSYLSANKRKKLFGIYKRMHETIDTVAEPNQLSRSLIDLVGEFYELIPHSEIQSWFKLYGKVVMPDNLGTEYTADNPPDRTYLRDDYIELVILAITFRFMIPVWGEYMQRVKHQTGTIYKEYAAMRLMSKANSVLGCQAMEKLRVYVEKSIPNDQSVLSAIFNGLGTQELPDFLLSLVIVRRLVVSDLDASKERGNVISNIFGFLTGVLKDLDRKFGGSVIDKLKDNDFVEEDNVSIVETYKVKQEVATGDVELLGAYVESPVRVAQTIDPGITAQMVKWCRSAVFKHQTMDIQQFQKTLVQWIIAPVISPIGVEYLNKSSLLNAMAVTQAILWRWGYYNLAALVTAEPVPMPDNTLIASDTRMRIPNHLVDRIVELYPYHHPAGDQGKARNNNVGCKAVRALAKSISGQVYHLYCPTDLRDKCTSLDGTGWMNVPGDLADSVAKLAIQLAEER